MRTVAEKMGIREGMRSILVNAQAEAVAVMKLPEIELESRLSGSFRYIHFFVITQADMHAKFPTLKEHLDSGGMLWLSWPKARQLETDLTLTKVIEIGYEYGLVESKTLSINSTWSAIKFTHPKEGKEYNNSYGKLKK